MFILLIIVLAIVIDDVCCYDVHVTNQFSYRNNKTENNLKDFCFAGQLDNKNCIFKIDTGSDISIHQIKLNFN